MRLPLLGRERPPLAPERSPLSESVWLGATAAVAVGMLVGAWVIGPALSGDPIEQESLRSAKVERQMLLAAAARPDPSPYRTPTPDFNMPNAPRYGMLAKEQAQAARETRGEKRDAIAEAGPYDAIERSSYDSPGLGIEAPKAASNYRHRRVDRASDISNY